MQAPAVSGTIGSLTGRYNILPPATFLLSISLDIPTTTSSSPIVTTQPLTSETTLVDLIHQLTLEFGLPNSSADLAGTYQDTSTNSKTSGALRSSSSARTIAWDEVRWNFMANDTKMDINNPVPIMQLLQGDETIRIAIDEDWLFERKDLPGTDKSGKVTSGEEDSDTLKASRSSSTIAEKDVPKIDTSPASSSRLSGRFHGWLDSSKNPAPPSSPQTTPIVRTVHSASMSPSEIISRQGLPDKVTARPVSVSGPMQIFQQGEPVRIDEEVDEEEWDRLLVRSRV